MCLIKHLLQACSASILLVSVASADVTQPAQQYSMNDLINDNLLNDEIKVLVQVRKITGVNAQGQRRILYEDKAGMLVRLDLLASAIQRLDGRMISAGKYADIQLDLSNDIHLFGKNSLVLRAPFSDHKGTTTTINAEGDIHVSPARVVTSQVKIEMDDFSKPLPLVLVRALLAATPTRGCGMDTTC